MNERPIVSDDRTAAGIAQVANGTWVRDQWLPQRDLEWDLLAASRSDASGWQPAWWVAARTPDSEALFVVVHDGNDQPWQILSLTR